MEMDKKTNLTKSIPDLMEKWQRYKRGLKGIKITDWCISSDYCFGDPDKLDVATFTIFPIGCMPTIYNEINNFLPRDIKNVTFFSEIELNYIKTSKYFFSISIIVNNIKYAFNWNKVLKHLSELLQIKETELPQEIPISDFQKSRRKLTTFYNYIKQKSYNHKLVAEIQFVAQTVSSIIEFLLIKEKGKIVGWCSDRGHITSFNEGIIFNLVQSYVHQYIKGRISKYQLAFPPELKEKHKTFLGDNFIRVPDILTGAMSSLVMTDKGLTVQKAKHGSLIGHCIVDNPHIIILVCDCLENDKTFWQRAFFESIDKSPMLKYNKELLEQFKKQMNELKE